MRAEDDVVMNFALRTIRRPPALFKVELRMPLNKRVRYGLMALTCAGALLTAAAIPARSTAATSQEAEEASVELVESQTKAIKVEPVGEHVFPQEQNAVGNIDFNEELLTQVYTPYQGRIIKAFASIGDTVKKDQILFTIDSPDLVQAESTLIAAAGVLELTTRVLERQQNLYKQNAGAQKDYEQSVSDHQTAEGNLKAARDAVRIFGKTDADIDKIIANRKIDSALVVPSPISGLITSRTASPGLFVQPGNPPPVYTVADTSIMWMLANVAEKDSPNLKVGQEVRVSVAPLPGRVFQGKIVTIGATVDPNTRRVLVRSEIADPNYELRSGMFATFVITIAPPKQAMAVPLEGVVREGDGTMTVWVTADKKKFTKRVVKIGLTHQGFAEILDGLKPGELLATDGSLFIANQYTNAGH
jgi:cobalt-zinc-cadmium efflux system membrane fusion protein